MRVMVMIKATPQSEAGQLPDRDLLDAMSRFNLELAQAGVLLGGEGLQASSQGRRVRFSGATRAVTDGPFAATGELIAGFWIWQVSSMAEALEWVRRCPNPMPGDSEIEIRPILEIEDFGEAATEELRKREQKLRQQVAAGLKSV